MTLLTLQSELIVVGVFAITAVLLLLQMLRARRGRQLYLGPHPAYEDLDKQVGRAIESGRRLHVSLGRAGLNSPAVPTSLAARAALGYLADESCRSGIPPAVTLGEGTLLPLAQRTVRATYEQAHRTAEYTPQSIQFIASDTAPQAYAAGVTTAIQHSNAGSNVLLGRFGSEIGLMAEAAARQNVAQVIGSDDPTALAVAVAYTDKLLIGEELLAAQAHLSGKSTLIAGLSVQNLLRGITILLILITAVLTFMG